MWLRDYLGLTQLAGMDDMVLKREGIVDEKELFEVIDALDEQGVLRGFMCS